VAAAVRAPFLDLSFSAAKGQGAHEAGRRLRVSDRPPERAVVATALPFRARELMADVCRAPTRPLRMAAAKAGRAEFLSLWAGQGVRMARRQGAGDLVTRLAAEADAAIERLAASRIAMR